MRRRKPKVHCMALATASRLVVCGLIGRDGNYAFNPDKVTCKRCVKILKSQDRSNHARNLSGRSSTSRQGSQH